MDTTVGRRLAAGVAGVSILSMAVPVALLALLAASRPNPDSFVAVGGGPNYPVAAVLAGFTATLVLAALAASARIAGNAHPNRSTLLGLAVLVVGLVAATVVHALLAVAGLGSVLVAIFAGERVGLTPRWKAAGAGAALAGVAVLGAVVAAAFLSGDTLSGQPNSTVGLAAALVSTALFVGAVAGAAAISHNPAPGRAVLLTLPLIVGGLLVGGLTASITPVLIAIGIAFAVAIEHDDRRMLAARTVGVAAAAVLAARALHSSAILLAPALVVLTAPIADAFLAGDGAESL